MSYEKYCPKGKTECEHFEFNIKDGKICNVLKKLKPVFRSIESWECCPFPSQKKLPNTDKYERAANIYLERAKNPDLSNVNMKDIFIQSCKDAGLKE